ncbi:hypothetical protein EDB85DRAFT_1218856 [Lactarius pseudohatsudake]|nr:hypothetical protein EDB85DRAFT_1218856 [Lactarius pseudohatsudake]
MTSFDTSLFALVVVLFPFRVDGSPYDTWLLSLFLLPLNNLNPLATDVDVYKASLGLVFWLNVLKVKLLRLSCPRPPRLRSTSFRLFRLRSASASSDWRRPHLAKVHTTIAGSHSYGS